MPGIFPEEVNGGLLVRDADGNPIPQPSVQNAYVPPPTFAVNCDVRYLPSDCTARLSSAQINALQAEILCLAATLDPQGLWSCSDPCNLSRIFVEWAAAQVIEFASISEVIAGIITNKIVAPDTLAVAVQRGVWNYAVATGSANALSANLLVAPANNAATEGMPIRISPTLANTGAATLSINGLPPLPIIRQGGGDLRAADVVPGLILSLVGTGSAFQVVGGTLSESGRLLAVRRFTTSGTYVPTPGMTFAIVEAVGAGAAGGGSANPAPSLVSVGASGTAGTWGTAQFTAAQIGASQPVTIGAAGQGAANAAGTNGGATSLGTIFVCPGGVGGGMLNGQTPPVANGNGAISGSATGANIASKSGTAPGPSIGLTSAQGIGASGGDSPFGAGGLSISANAVGNNANGNGAGGGGICILGGGGAVRGGHGSAGLLIIMEYGA